jgi:hypothetical protein
MSMLLLTLRMTRLPLLYQHICSSSFYTACCVQVPETEHGAQPCFANLQDLGRHNYVTPTSYLELITAFRTLLDAKRAQVYLQHFCLY